MTLPVSRVVDNGGLGFLAGTTISQADMDAELNRLYGGVNELYTTKLAKAGGTMTGALVLSGNATAALNPVAKQQWDATNTGAGLTASGSLAALTETTYAQAAASLRAAFVLLDAAVKAVNDARGAASGIATLNPSGKLSSSQIPDGLIFYSGVWNASTNTPALSDATGYIGQAYTVGTGGTRNLGSGSITVATGDWMLHNGTIWEKRDNTDDVTSVAGRTGAVTLANTDISGLGAAAVAAIGSTAGTVCAGDDSRLSNSRTPVSHDHSGNKLAQANTHESADTDAATSSLHHTIGTGANNACAGNDARLSNSRTPVSHDHSSDKLAQANTHETPDTDSATSALHHTLGTGANNACAGNDARLTNARTPTSHSHSADKLLQANTHETPDTDSAPTALHHTLGTGANNSCAGNDSRLSDARTPSSHDHSGNKLTQANTHESADTDSATSSLHHTIGTGATNAAAGNHTHTGLGTAAALTAGGSAGNLIPLSAGVDATDNQWVFTTPAGTLGQHSAGSSVLTTDVTGNAASETKATGFNKALGTTSGTVAEGNHAHAYDSPNIVVTDKASGTSTTLTCTIDGTGIGASASHTRIEVHFRVSAWDAGSATFIKPAGGTTFLSVGHVCSGQDASSAADADDGTATLNLTGGGNAGAFTLTATTISDDQITVVLADVDLSNTLIIATLTQSWTS